MGDVRFFDRMNYSRAMINRRAQRSGSAGPIYVLPNVQKIVVRVLFRRVLCVLYITEFLAGFLIDACARASRQAKPAYKQ